jgi:uncharacterized YigZ family protein
LPPDPVPAPITILIHACESSHEVKRSIFVAIAEPLSEPAKVEALLKKHHHTDARHHCWAWRCNGEYRFSDDGEPAGTAGRPILQALEGADIDRCMVIVRRHFGGIKLGAGGLVRAYSSATTGCLTLAQTRQLTPHIHLELQVPFEYTQALFQLMGQFQTLPPVHSNKGVTMNVLVSLEQRETLLNELLNQTRGQSHIQRGDTVLA